MALPARWANEDSFLLWSVDDKWCLSSLVLIKLEKGEVKWQRDFFPIGQQAILTHARIARPEQYEVERKRNEGSGSAFPDGFTVDVRVEGKPDEPLTFPLVVHAYLTSDPKGDTPENKRMDARLSGLVDKDGNFKVTEFYFGTKPPSPKWD